MINSISESTYQFFLFVSFISLFLGGVALLILSLIAIIELAIRIFEKLENIIKSSPNIGVRGDDGNFVFQKGRFTMKYRLVNPDGESGQKKIELVAMKTRLMGYEREINNFKMDIRRFWDRGLIFSVSRLFLFLFPVILIFYLAVFEPDFVKINRLRGIISNMLNINREKVGMKSDGWVTISGERLTAVDKKREDVSYHVSLYDWLIGKDAGYIFRDRGVVQNHDYGHVIYPVSENNGNINMEKDGKLIHGRSDWFGTGMNWDNVQGTGIREGQVLGHDEHDAVRQKNSKSLFEDK